MHRDLAGNKRNATEGSNSAALSERRTLWRVPTASALRPGTPSGSGLRRTGRRRGCPGTLSDGLATLWCHILIFDDDATVDFQIRATHRSSVRDRVRRRGHDPTDETRSDRPAVCRSWRGVLGPRLAGPDGPWTEAGAARPEVARSSCRAAPPRHRGWPVRGWSGRALSRRPGRLSPTLDQPTGAGRPSSTDGLHHWFSWSRPTPSSRRRRRHRSPKTAASGTDWPSRTRSTAAPFR
jgi:hypothetical protein